MTMKILGKEGESGEGWQWRRMKQAGSIDENKEKM